MSGVSSRLEKQHSDLAQIEVDEMLRLVRDVRSEIPPDDAMPGRVVFLVEFLLDVGSDVLFYVELLHGLRGRLFEGQSVASNPKNRKKQVKSKEKYYIPSYWHTQLSTTSYC